MKEYKRFFNEETLEEECPTPQQNGPGGHCKRAGDGAKLLGKCQDGHKWDDQTNKCVPMPKK